MWGAVGSELSFRAVPGGSPRPPARHAAHGAAGRGHTVPTAMSPVPVPRAAPPLGDAALLALPRGGRALPPSVLPQPRGRLFAPPPAPLPGPGSGHGGSARRGQRGHSRSALCLHLLPPHPARGSGMGRILGEGTAGRQKAPEICLGLLAGLELPAPGEQSSALGRERWSCCRHSQWHSCHHPCVRPACRWEGIWGLPGRREAFPSRTGFGQHHRSWIQPQRFYSPWPGGSGPTRVWWLGLPG